MNLTRSAMASGAALAGYPSVRRQRVSEQVRQGPDPILLEFTPADAAWANALDLAGFAWCRVMWHYFPLRSLALGLALTGIAWLGFASLPGVLAGLIATVLMMVLERTRRSDFLTPTHIVRRSGLLGATRLTIDLNAIERVELRPSMFGDAFGAADIEIHTAQGVFLLPSIGDAEPKAQRILEARDALRH
jgi:hypothetical protein